MKIPKKTLFSRYLVFDMNLDFLSGLKIKITENADLRRFTTFQLGGACQAVIECTDAATLQELAARLRAHRHHFLIMGFGSNILASDKGIPVIIVRYYSKKPVIQLDGNTLATDAAAPLDDLARYAITRHLEGLTALSGIPGTVGGAIAGNAGAYGKQICDHLASVTALMPDNTVLTIPGGSIAFGYRDSPFKRNGAIILSAAFALTPAENPSALHAKRREIMAARLGKHGSWKKNPCAGSFFRNVEPTEKNGPRQAAGWFLEKSGAKDIRVNGAHAYPKHANIITRDDGASAQDVYDLTIRMAGLVKTAFNIELIREVRLLGFFDKAEGCNAEGFW
ncbi:MAG: UDP-N-acetylmuramate dehydrogenase [Candidatus Omnitrophota bacterium]